MALAAQDWLGQATKAIISSIRLKSKCFFHCHYKSITIKKVQILISDYRERKDKTLLFFLLSWVLLDNGRRWILFYVDDPKTRWHLLIQTHDLSSKITLFLGRNSWDAWKFFYVLLLLKSVGSFFFFWSREGNL